MKNTTGTASRTGNTHAVDSSRTQTTSNKQAGRGSLLAKFFTDMLQDMYWAENHLIEKLQVMMKAATTEELQDAFEDHMYATQKHKRRLEKVFEMIGEKATAKKCEAMEGLAKEAESIIKETQEGTMTRDAALIIAAQKIEHYEIASYGSLVQIARTLQYEQAATLLEKTLWEEEDTDELLTDIAESDINPMADEEEAETESKTGKEKETATMEA